VIKKKRVNPSTYLFFDKLFFIFYHFFQVIKIFIVYIKIMKETLKNLYASTI